MLCISSLGSFLILCVKVCESVSVVCRDIVIMFLAKMCSVRMVLSDRKKVL